MRLCINFAAFFLLLGLVAAKETTFVYHKKDLAVTSCQSLITKTATLFGTKDKIGYCNVKNQPALGTIAHCLTQGFVNDTSLQQNAITSFLESCSKYNLTRDQFDAAYTNASSFSVDPSKVEGFNKTKLFSLPIKLKNAKIRSAYDSNYSRFFNYNYAMWFGTALVSYWFFVLIIAGVCNLVHFLFPGMVNTLSGTISNTFRKYISLPATFKKDHAHSIHFFAFISSYIPTRLESIIVFVWFILALVFNIVYIDHTPNNFIWTSKEAEMGRKISDRSGVISIFLIPVNILFAGRNNFLQWVSGWSYSRMLVFHRWTSRIMFVLVLIHTVAMICSKIALNKILSTNSKAYVQWGYVGTVAGFLMCVQSIAYFRRNHYELFLLSHIILAALFIAGGWIHVADRGYQQWYYAATAIWVFDRVVRFFRLFAFGIKTAKLEIKVDEILKVTVPRPKYWKPFPGCHAFIHFLRPSCFWQSHPFTIVDTKVDDGSNEISFYIKIKGGATHGLYKYLVQQPGQSANIRVVVEGPYGNRIPIDRIDNSVFISGGNGIPGLYSEAIDLARRVSDKSTKRIKFYWIIREWKSFGWFLDEFKRLENTKVEPIVYITRPDLDAYHSQTDSSEEEKVDNEKSIDDSFLVSEKIKSEFPFIEFREGRPVIDELVKQDISELEGSKCFVTCGHAAMCDEIRSIIANNLGLSKDRVDYFEQLQTW